MEGVDDGNTGSIDGILSCDDIVGKPVEIVIVAVVTTASDKRTIMPNTR